MTMQKIERDNGVDLIGNFQTLVFRSETDCDVWIPGEDSPESQIQPYFELHQRFDSTWLVVVAVYDSHFSHRHAQDFASLQDLIDFTNQLDPCQFVPNDRLNDVSECDKLRQRYTSRLKNFLRRISELMPEFREFRRAAK